MKQTGKVAPVGQARCQSVDGHFPRTAWAALRRFVHLPYIRAIVTAVCLIAIVGSLAALTLAVKHDVSALAVYRYFVRPHFEEADLGQKLRSGSTVLQLEPFLLLPPGVTPGGLVYAEEHGLVFYVHTPRRPPAAARERRERTDIFNTLTSLYWKADLNGLTRELNRPAVRQRLIDRGAQLKDLYLFQRFNGKSVDSRARTEVLRAAVRQIQLVAPYIPEPFQLDFAEVLRFYDRNRTDGEFVGLWEVATPSPFGVIDAAYAHEMSRTNHYIIISRHGGRTTVSDFYRGVRSDYLVQPLGHPSGRTFYRLTAQPAS